MPELGFCKPCLEKGHRCETRNRDLYSNFICVFCEDGEECPIAQQERKAKQVCCVPGCKQKLIDNSTTGKCGRHSVAAHKAARESAPKKIAPTPPAQPSPTRRKSNSPWGKFGSLGLNRTSEKQAPASPAIQQGVKKMPKGQGLTPCICGCGGMANTRWKYIKGHKPATGAAPIAITPAKKAVKKISASTPQQVSGHATITVPETYLDNWFSKLPVEQKASQFSAWLENKG